MSAKTLGELEALINNYQDDEGQVYSAEVIQGEVEVLQVVIQEKEEFPIYVTVDDSQILCTTYIWKESEIKQDTKAELTDMLITMNVPMPLSSFSKVGDQYIIFGSLSVNSSDEDICHEISILSDNTIDAVETFSDYLQ